MNARSRLLLAQRAIITCNDCPRLRDYCIHIGEVKKAAHHDDIYWAKPVPGFGDPRARVLIIGLAPAAHGANRTGRVFTGDAPGGSGDFLMEAMHAWGFANRPTTRHKADGLKLHDAFIVAAVRCAPPDNKPTPDEVRRCERHLDAEFEALRNVQVIVALGKIAWDATFRLLDRRRGLSIRPRPTFAHGARIDLPKGLVVIGSFHPSRQNTNTGKLTQRMMRRVFADAADILRVQSSGPGFRWRLTTGHDAPRPTPEILSLKPTTAAPTSATVPPRRRPR